MEVAKGCLKLALWGLIPYDSVVFAVNQNRSIGKLMDKPVFTKQEVVSLTVAETLRIGLVALAALGYVNALLAGSIYVVIGAGLTFHTVGVLDHYNKTIGK